ncbi:MAG: putative phosphohydrolase [Ilumatobacteraceae bacterium]|nr:putative phosphohydrolase [Ilumatobacteraceae bacterium]
MGKKSLYKGDGRVKTYTLPVSGSVVLYGPEIDVVQTAEFQRLAGLKQLGTSYVVFRGALHTRFEHSLGALHQAERMMQAIERNPKNGAPIDRAARRLARLGALLHDLPHVPFGHTLEDEFKLLQRHDVNKARIKTLLVKSDIGGILRSALPDGEFEQLVAVLDAKKDEEFAELEYPFVGDIVGNTVCADLLDYVPRDLTACGLPVALGDRFLDYLTISDDGESKLNRRRIVLNLDKGGMPRPDVESEVVKLLSYRYELAERVYFHHAKNAASVMIGRAVFAAGLAVGEDSPKKLDRNFHWLSDEMLLQALAVPEVADAMSLVRANSVTPEGIELASDLAQGVLDRRMFKIAYIGVHDDMAVGAERVVEEYGGPEARMELEDRLARQAGLDSGDVLVHIPRFRMMRKDADVRVRAANREILKLNEWDALHSRRIDALNQAHERLWRVTVYIRPELEAAVAIVRAAAEETFHAPSRYGDAPLLRPYLRAVFDQHQEARGWTYEDLRRLEAKPLAAFSEASSLDAIVDNLHAHIGVLREQ